MPSADDARRDLLNAARRLLTLTEGEAPGPFTVVISHGAALAVPSGNAESSNGTYPPQLPRQQLDIWRALTAQAVPARRLARLAGRKYNSSFRAALASLVEGGHARHTRKGYSR